MNLMALVRKGFGYVLMCMGVSRPGTKSKPAPKPASGPQRGS